MDDGVALGDVEPCHRSARLPCIVIPAKAEIHGQDGQEIRARRYPWIPAFAGMTAEDRFNRHHIQPIDEKNTANTASSTITRKIACTTEAVVRRPTSSA